MHDKVKAGQNPEELFDVVNDRDEVVAKATRREVHQKNLPHRAVHILVFDKFGRVFLQKRSMSKDTAPGTWAASCAGHVDSGEDYDAAAVRELNEELGVKVEETPARWLRFRASPETGYEFLWIYRMENEGPFVLNPAEIDTGDWFLPAEITKGVLERPAEYAPSFCFIWSRLALELEG